MTLKELAAQLKPLIASDTDINNLHYGKTAQTWIWIFDGKSISDEEVHYEIIKRSDSYRIELHFEASASPNRILIIPSSQLPTKIKHQKHQGQQAFAYTTTFNPNHPNLVQDIFNGLKDFVGIMDEFYYSNIPPVSNKQTDNNQDTPMNQPLNQILYGPPGTGKTYATKELAVKIANPGFQVATTLNEAEQRLEISREYQRLFDAGQIVFTTFHQSMSYEDFVEGIKPETLNNDVVYNVQPGLFKLMCEKASIKSNSNFEDVLEHFKEDVMSKPATIETGRSKFDVFYYGSVTFRINPHDSAYENPNYPASIENLLKYYQTDSLKGIYNPSYIRGIINHLYDKYGLVKYNNVTESPDKNYVLIIDEINRGNVSAIFGELITLLEADKRIGAPEEISLKLPYSKTDFGVPSNLYIIGTMNTADRSVEALDTALRRRFSFVEVMPNHNILDREVEGFNLKNILKTINNRVEALLDRDHTIGHSYFIKVNDKASLVHAFKNCIIPLLQEYFYGDYEKINLVLGDGFIEQASGDSIIFAGKKNYGLSIAPKYNFIELTEDTITDAINQMLN